MALHLFAPFARFRLVVLLTAFIGLAACGGGGDDGAAPASVTYTGKTTPADMTATNANSLTLSAYDGGTMASGASPLGVQTQTNNERGMADALSVVRIAQEVMQRAESPTSASATGALVEIAPPMPGDCGGTVVMSADDSGAPVIGFAFNAYCDSASGITLQGQMTMTVIGGAVDAPTAVNVTMSLLIKENATGIVYRLDNYDIDVATTYDSLGAVIERSVSYSGTFYSPSEGYVALATETAFYYPGESQFPTAGVLVVTEVGSSPAAKARLTAQSDGVHYTIEVDLNGDGTYGDTGAGEPATYTGTWV